MNMRQWNMMALALCALIVNSSPAQAETITSLGPTPAQPGQVVTLHGRFNAANFRSNQYRFMLNKRITPRRVQGAINGFIETFRVTSTTAIVRIPSTWQGKSVYPGEYVLSIKDTTRNHSVFNGIPISIIASGARSALGAAKGTMRGQIKQGQQQRLGGKIGKTVRPRIAAARGAPQMKLTLKGLKVNNRDVIMNSVSIGDNVVAKFEIQNLGTAVGRVKVGYMTSALINARPQFVTNGFVSVAPGQTLPMLLNVRINTRNVDRNINRGAWNPVFRLLTTSNTTYRDSDMADNTVVRNGIPLKPKQDLAITHIKNVSLKESYLDGGQWDNGTTHPISLAFMVKVKNNGLQTSRPTRLSVTIMGTRSAMVDALRDPKLVRHSVGVCTGGWPKCTMNKDVSIPAIVAGQTSSIRVRFNRIIPHQIVWSKRHFVKKAVGPYLCGWGGNIHGRASISAFIRQADVDEAPSFRWNNRLILTGKFDDLVAFRRGSAVSACGMINTKVTRR